MKLYYTVQFHIRFQACYSAEEIILTGLYEFMMMMMLTALVINQHSIQFVVVVVVVADSVGVGCVCSLKYIRSQSVLLVGVAFQMNK